MKLWFIYVACAVWFAWAMLFNDIMIKKPGVGMACLAVGLLGWFPVIRWLQNGMRTLPVFEIFCAFHLFYYVHPALQQITILDQYDDSIQIRGLLAVFVFLLMAQSVFYLSLGRSLKRRAATLSRGWLATYRLPDLRRSLNVWMLLWGWVAFDTLNRIRLFPDLGALYQPLNTAVMGGGLFAVFNLTFAFGKKEMPRRQQSFFFLALAIQSLMDLSSGFLSGFARTAIIVFLSYTMAARRMPVTAIVSVFLAMAFLHVGKGEMREKFWGPKGQNEAKNPIVVGRFWIAKSFEKISSGQISSTTAMTKILDRGSLTHMISLAVENCPQHREYLSGETYFQLPLLLIPRILWAEKPRGTWSSETLAVHMGVQTVEATNFTSIGMGQVAEGWINFGWAGVILAGMWFGLLLSLPARLSLDCTADRARMLISASCLPLATDLEHCLSQWTVIMVNSLLVATVAIYILCRRERRRSGIAAVAESGLNGPM